MSIFNWEDVDTPLECLSQDVWAYGEQLKPLGGDWVHRMTVVRLDSGELWVHSPASFSDGLRSELQGLGEIQCIVAPSRMHDLHLKAWQKHFPKVSLYAAPGLAKDQPGLRIHAELTGKAPARWQNAFEQYFVQGIPAFNEVVFFHKKSRSLILADLAINVCDAGTLLGQIVGLLFGLRQGFTPSRFFKFMVRDREVLRNAIETILKWDFERIIVGHGKIIEPDGKAAFGAAYRWLL